MRAIEPGECIVDRLQMLPCAWQDVSPRVLFWVRALDLVLFELAWLFVLVLLLIYYSLNFRGKFPWE